MKEFDTNSTSEMLTQLVDSELDSSQEEIVFSELSKNQELRNEFRDLVAIRDAISKDTEAFTPPKEVTTAVFASLGFSSASVSKNVVATTPLLLRFFKKAWLPAAAAIFASLITYYAVYNSNTEQEATLTPVVPLVSSLESPTTNQSSLSNRGDDFSKNFNAQGSQNIKTSKLNNNQSNNKVLLNSNESLSSNLNDNKIGIGSTAEPELTVLNDIKENNITEIVSQQEAILPVKLNSSQYYINENRNLLPSTIGCNSNSSLAIIQLSRFGNQKSKGDYILNLRGMLGATFPSTNMPSGTNSSVSNVGVGIYTNVYSSKNFKAGVEFGREPFSQVFFLKDFNSEVKYDQDPLLFWGTLAVHYDISQTGTLLFGGQPFARLLIGATEIGPLSKGIIGLQYYSSEKGYGIFFGIEGSLLLYENQGIMYDSRKIGLTFGTALNLGL